MSLSDTTGPRSRTDVVIRKTGQVRVTGHLTRQGVDLLRGAVDSLLRGGRHPVVVDLAGLLGTDDAALGELSELRDDPDVQVFGDWY